MRVLVTGAKGQLGYDVVKELEKRGHKALGVDREEMDLTSIKQIKDYIKKSNPEAIIHCGAYTLVDKAEDEKELCKMVNSTSTKDIARCSKALDIPMIYISTDYVFDGTKDGEYIEDDLPNPINVYGKTKYEGEVYVQEILEKYYIVRISWVFGENGNNFVDTMLRLSKERELLSVINDQVGSPTYTKDLARLLVDMLKTNKYGIYHATNEGYCTWYEFAREIFKIANVDVKVNKINTCEYPTKARRPLNSKMSKEKLKSMGFSPLRNWKEALEEYVSN